MARRWITQPLAPVQKIEVSGEHMKLRFAAMLLLFALGFGALGYWMHGLLTKQPGWIRIEADKTVPVEAGADLDFEYCLGENATAENKQLTVLYTEAVLRCYQVYHPTQRFDGVENLCAVNEAPNRALTVEPELYAALARFQAKGDRSVFLAPVYAQYDAVFRSLEDGEAALYDPMRNPEAAAYVRELMGFIRDPEAVSLSLLGDNQVRLNVREDYLRFAEAYEIDAFLDLNWMKNAFVLDDLAERLREKGFLRGYLVSAEGFCRYLDPTETSYTLELLDNSGTAIRNPAVLELRGPVSVICLHGYGAAGGTGDWFYHYGDGSVRTPYLDLDTGESLCAIRDLTLLSADKGCAELVLAARPAMAAETWDPAGLIALADEGIGALWCEAGTVCHTPIPAHLTIRDEAYRERTLP